MFSLSKWVVPFSFLMSFGILYGQGSHLEIKRQSVDSSLTVDKGYSALIYLNNELYNKSSTNIIIRWTIDSIKSDIPDLEGGICTEVCYPSSLTSNVEPIRANDSLPFKAYFTVLGGFQQSGTATLYASVYDTLDSAGTFLSVSFTLHLTVDTATVGSLSPSAKSQCLITRGNSIYNNCSYNIKVAIYDRTGKLVKYKELVPSERIHLPVDKLLYVVPVPALRIE
ncbi:MAG: hypothetical protein GXO48_03865 [Chlorobi bacterium]|nr:hypothetical protein [Chlorobiota bacterium]